jgi:hypothetical protein
MRADESVKKQSSILFEKSGHENTYRGLLKYMLKLRGDLNCVGDMYEDYSEKVSVTEMQPIGSGQFL